MSLSIFKTSVLFVSFIVGAAVAAAQTTQFAHQGTLPPNPLLPETGFFEMEVRLFDAAAGGAQIGPAVTLMNVAVTENRFVAAPLDFGAAAFPGSDRFLEFRVRRQGSAATFIVVSPRDKVLSVPYAIRALEASSIGGFEPGDFIQNRTSQQPASNFNISGTGRAATFNATTVNASGTVSAAQVNLGSNTLLRAPQLNSIVVGRAAGVDLAPSGSNNSFFGAFAGGDATTGTDNTYAGFFAGNFNLTGSHNSAFGETAGALATGSGNSYFGSGAGGNTSSTGNNNTFIGRNADFIVSQNVPSGNNTLLGANAKVDQIFNAANIQFATAIGAGAVVTESDTIMLGKPGAVYDGQFRGPDNVMTSGFLRVGAFESAVSTPVCRNGDGFLANCSSSLRYKTDVQPYLGGLDVVRQLKPISFAWKENGTQELGFGAEEVFKTDPRFTFRNGRNELEGVLYGQITTALVNAVKEQQQQIESLTEQVNALKKLVCSTNKDAEPCRK